jgi:hypothetical protein
MDYERIYYEFILDRRLREEAVVGGARHHIVPRSLGGTNEETNIIRLTHEDHLFAHLLLAQFGGSKMAHAAHMMLTRTGVVRGREARARYGWVKRAHAAAVSKMMAGRDVSPETRAKIAEYNRTHTGWKHSPETRQKMSAAKIGWRMPPEIVEKIAAKNRGRKLSDEHRAKISARHKGRKRPPELVEKTAASRRGQKASEETRAKLSASHKGKTPSPETRARMSAARMGHETSAETRKKISETPFVLSWLGTNLDFAVLSFEISQAENDFASLSVVIPNPRVGCSLAISWQR